jgi:hypothetical protein
MYLQEHKVGSANSTLIIKMIVVMRCSKSSSSLLRSPWSNTDYSVC